MKIKTAILLLVGVVACSLNARAFYLRMLDTLASLPNGHGPLCEVYDPFDARWHTYDASKAAVSSLTSANGVVACTYSTGHGPWTGVYDPGDRAWHTYDANKAAVASLTNVQGVVAFTYSTGHGPGCAVYDPGDRAWHQYDANKAAVSNLTSVNGVVACTYSTGQGPWTGAYDPGDRTWHTYDANKAAVASLTNVQGVVAFTYSTGHGPWTAVYDPGDRAWHPYNANKAAVTNLVCADGIVACIYSTGHGPFIATYSAQDQSWHTHDAGNAAVSSLVISNGVVSWTASGKRLVYQAAVAPRAYFACDQIAGNAPLYVQFSDNSIGGVDSYWWNFGDGGGSSERSPSHSFTGIGIYTVTLQVTGPGGSHSTSMQIKTDVLAPSGSIVINGDAPYTNSTLVSLTYAATDNSGSVASMRFSNDGATWSGWEPYGTTKSWSLTGGDGLKTVYVQFMDLAGNASGSYSDSITLSLNDAPTDIGLSPATVAENQPTDAIIGALSTTDPDAGGTFVYALVPGAGGTDNALFAIAGDTLRAAISFDYETRTSCSIRIRSQDQGGLAVEKVFAISITPAPIPVIYVNRANQSPYPNGSQWAPFPTVAQGYQAARNGDTIRVIGDVTPTDYPEKLDNMSKAVTIEAPSGIVNIGKGAPP